MSFEKGLIMNFLDVIIYNVGLVFFGICLISANIFLVDLASKKYGSFNVLVAIVTLIALNI